MLAAPKLLTISAWASGMRNPSCAQLRAALKTYLAKTAAGGRRLALRRASTYRADVSI
jgi:hypothetical protein